MEETKNLMDKTASELTVKDQLIVTVITPLIAVAGVGAAAGAVKVYSKIAAQSRAVRENRRKQKLQIVK